MPSEKPKSASLHKIEFRIVKLELEHEYNLKACSQRDEILKQVVLTQQMLGEKIIGIEATLVHRGGDIISLKKDTKLQNKVLAAILTSSIATIIGLIAKSVLAIHG